MLFINLPYKKEFRGFMGTLRLLYFFMKNIKQIQEAYRFANDLGLGNEKKFPEVKIFIDTVGETKFYSFETHLMPRSKRDKSYEFCSLAYKIWVKNGDVEPKFFIFDPVLRLTVDLNSNTVSYDEAKALFERAQAIMNLPTEERQIWWTLPDWSGLDGKLDHSIFP